jgi:hypothetical protein
MTIDKEIQWLCRNFDSVALDRTKTHTRPPKEDKRAAEHHSTRNN